ncbi:Por secretion system C-terminal sorting domain-containing protein [Chryseobacterium ureilyticum]|uniref:Neutral metalloproteinase n=1 Tax=Chryseobacterium ureilyticum TaxID=373668 RepID=A0A1N7QP81_9FLAO|nr:M4 family metallopeptidase [Chryseobacterium ureilyticum]SIT24628.1 Por secretion system C-terminal sorting domain-containing protein [Chryseobacterium ureilyticum]
MKKTLTIIKTLCFSLSVGLAPLTLVQAQEKSIEVSTKDLPRILTSSAMGNFYANFNGKKVSTDFLIPNLNKWFGIDSNHTFEFVSAKTDDIGVKRSVFQHFYKKVKVADELILVHEKDGKVLYVNGELTGNINLVVDFPLAKEKVEKIVSEDLGTPNVNFADFEQFITKVDEGEEIGLYSTSQINAVTRKGLKAYVFYIDNKSGKIVKKLSKIYKDNLPSVINPILVSEKKSVGIVPVVTPLLDTSSTSATYYKGNRNITVDSFNGQFRLKNTSRNIYTRDGTGWDGDADFLNGELTGTINEYTNSTANFTSVATKPAVEVHWAMEISHDYYMNRHNRNSYDGNGSIIKNYYNINMKAGSNEPYDGANAGAIDAQGLVVMIYGNGKVEYQGQLIPILNPVVGIDIAGHEYSHLLVSRTANLAYERESGALNESFADMFGTAIEFYSGVNPNWTMGEGIPNPAIGAFMRSMSNPNSGPVAFGSQQPDTYKGTYWKDASASCTPNTDNDRCGVHTNSGVGNYWFYLLSQGGSGTNDNGTAFNVSGITIQKAEKIAYRTLANYLTANSAYIDAYNGSIQAVIDLYGAGSNEHQQVENAWCAVGLGNCANVLAVSDVVKTDKQQLKIYPNPVNNGRFTIESDIKGNVEYEIFDLSGKLIKPSEKLKSGINDVIIGQVGTGVYVVKIKTDGKTISKKVVVK